MSRVTAEEVEELGKGGCGVENVLLESINNLPFYVLYFSFLLRITSIVERSQKQIYATLIE